MQRNPNYYFKGREAIGIYDVPLESLIVLQNTEKDQNPGDVRILVKVGQGALVENSTIGEFIDDPDLWREGIGQSGTDGKDGVDGVDGIPGADGNDGMDGQDGQDGLRGQEGRQGIQGVHGLDGHDGRDGIDGVDGINGTNGKDGAEGPEGHVGATGPRGQQGVAGIGIDGKDGSGVQIKGTMAIDDILLTVHTPNLGDMWLANNTDANASVPGVAGDGYVCVKLIDPATNHAVWENVGPIRGPRGGRGVNGRDGIDGRDGVDGQRGPTGNTGPIGIQGPRGQQGVKGDHGPVGPEYDPDPLKLLNKIKTVDGAGSGLDADLIDGKDVDYFSPAGHKHPISDVNTLQQELNKRVQPQHYATNTKGGTVKMRLSGDTLYLTNDGTNA